MNETLNKELWMMESTEFTMSDGTTVNGFRINYVRNLENGESIDDIDEKMEYSDVIDGTVSPTYVDENFDPIDENDVIDEDVEMLNPTFYVGDENGRPIE